VCQGKWPALGILIVPTLLSILSCPFEGKESEKLALRESDNMREKIAARYTTPCGQCLRFVTFLAQKTGISARSKHRGIPKTSNSLCFQ
jgi:hypothetical protein